MRPRIQHLLAAALLVAFAIDASGETPLQELDALGVEAQGLIDGGELDAAQAKAAGKVVAAADKAKASAGEDETKLLKKLPGVAKKVESGAKKGLDLADRLAALDTAVGTRATNANTHAREIGEILAVEKHSKKVLSLVTGGEAQLAAAGALPVGAKRMKKLVGAMKKFAKAQGKADAYFQQELDGGDLAVTVEEILLDGTPLVAGAQLTPMEHELRIRVNLPVYADAMSPEAVVIERGEGEFFPLRAAGAPAAGELELNLLIDPLEPGEYNLLIRGLDDPSGSYFVGARLVPLAESIRIPVTAVP